MLYTNKSFTNNSSHRGHHRTLGMAKIPTSVGMGLQGLPTGHNMTGMGTRLINGDGSGDHSTHPTSTHQKYSLIQIQYSTQSDFFFFNED